jgi:hypothetical protein
MGTMLFLKLIITILTHHDLGFKKIGAITQSNSFEKALDNYHKDKLTF